MSHPSTHHHHLLLNSIPPIHHHHRQSLTVPIKQENNSDDDVVLLSIVPKVVHTPENYDPECQCSTCQLVRELLTKCTCEECRGQQTNQVNQTEGQVVESSENVPIANSASPTNGQPSSSSIQNNDASTSEHTNANDLDDDHSRSSTPDYLPRFFDDESGDSSSDDSEDDDSEEDHDSVDSGVDQESESDAAENNSDPDYVLPRSITNKSLKRCKSSTKHIKTNDGTTLVTYNQATDVESNSSDIESDDYENNSESEKSQRYQGKSFVCPKCESSFDQKWKLLRHYRALHLEWKPFYCKWPKCDFVHGIHSDAVHHVYRKHLNMKNRKKGRKYVGKREWSSSSQEDPIYESILGNISFNPNCPKCGRNFTHAGHFRRHLGSHNKSEFRCTWLQCGFFFSNYNLVKQHILKEHFKGEMVNSTQLSEHLVKVDPELSIYNGFQNNDVFTSEHNNANHHDDKRERSSTPDYLPPFFDDESRDSSLDGGGDAKKQESESEDDDLIYDVRKNCESGDEDVSDPDFAFSKPSTSKSLKSSNNRSRKHTKTMNPKKRHKCRLCRQYFSRKQHLVRHDRVIHQQLKPFYCKWPKCNFVGGRKDGLIEHVTLKHLNHRKNVQKANLLVGERKTN